MINFIKVFGSLNLHLLIFSHVGLGTCLTVHQRAFRSSCKSLSSNTKPVQIISIDFNTTTSVNDIHETFMAMALTEAKEAGISGEVPIGAIVLREISSCDCLSCDIDFPKNKYSNRRIFELLSRGRNEVERKQDSSAHAELQAMRSASSYINNWRLINTTLYSTLEPCPMCLAASQAFRISKIVYGAPDIRLGAVKSHINLLDMAKHPFHTSLSVIGDVKKEECSKILVDFFRNRRKEGMNLMEKSPQSVKHDDII